MKNKGFTMVELLAVISILAVILLIAVPVFSGVRDRTNQSIYESKIANIKAASEGYSEESGKMVFDVKTLIRAGKLEADNESGEYRNPVNGQDMRCYIVNVRYEDMQYYANVHEMMTCLDEATLEALYGAVRIVAYNNEKDTIINPYYQEFYKEPLFVGFELTQNSNYSLSNIVKITWTGDQSKTCTKENGNIESCLFYNDTPMGIPGTMNNFNVNLEVTFRNQEGAEFTSRVSKHLAIDLENPKVASYAVGLGMTNQSGKRVDIELTDGNGSGLKEYKMVKVANPEASVDCNNGNQYKKVEQNKITEYKDNGYYYVCVKDNVENNNQDTVKNTLIQVTGVDYSQVNGVKFTVTASSEETPLKVNAKVTIPNTEDASKLKMCVSNTGYLKDCSWEKFKSSFVWNLTGNADCKNRNIYLSITDEAGNITNIMNSEYKPEDTVKYYPSPGALTNASDNKKVACYGGTYSLPNAKREGYTLSGWYTKATGGSQILTSTKVNTNGVINLYAHWTINSYNISYNLDKGKYGKSHPSSAKYDEKITIDNPTREGYNFTGWTITGMDHSTHTYGNASTTADKLTDRKETTYKNLRITSGTVTFKATWKSAACESCTVTFDANGGQWDEKTKECITVSSSNHGELVEEDETEGYYYYTMKDSTCYMTYKNGPMSALRRNDLCNPSYDVYYYKTGIKWRERVYYQCKLNHPTSKTSSVKKGIIQNKPSEPYLEGQAFDGWYTAKNGGEKIEDSTLINGNMTLYAHWKDVGDMDYNNYDEAKKISCQRDLLIRFIDNYTSKFENAVNNSQNFRNALYDCKSVSAGAIYSSQQGYPVLRRSGRTTIVSGRGQGTSCTCNSGSESRSAQRTCEKPACEALHEQFMSNLIYDGRIFVLSATTTSMPPKGSPKCVDYNGYGDCDNEGKTWDVWGYKAILIGDKYNHVEEGAGWGDCNSKTTNAVFNADRCGYNEERYNHIAIFQDGLKVGLYALISKSTESGKGDKDYNYYKDYPVYVQIFKI